MLYPEPEAIRDSRLRPEYRVSALVSCYDAAEYIADCLRDLTAQTLFAAGDLEIIVVDSASPAGEWAIIEDFVRRFPHILALRTHERETLYQAWNRAIALSRGFYLTNSNTDDRRHPNALRRLSQTLDSRPAAALVYSDCFIAKTPVSRYEEYAGNEILRNADYFAPSNLIYHQFGPMPMWRRAAFDKIGPFDPSFTATGDYEWSIRLALEYDALHLPEPLGVYRLRADAVSFRDQSATIENQKITDFHKNFGTALRLYRRAGIEVESPEMQTAIAVDAAIRALEYYSPIRAGALTRKPQLALKMLDECAALHPDRIELYETLAVAAVFQGEFAAARKLFAALEQRGSKFAGRNLQAVDEALRSGVAAGELVLPAPGLNLPTQRELTWGTATPSQHDEKGGFTLRIIEKSAASRTGSQRPPSIAVPNSNDLIQEALGALRQGDAATGVALIDRALDVNPGFTAALDLLRLLEGQLPTEWSAGRDAEIAGHISSTKGRERLKWILRSGQFHNAPKSMAAAWQSLQAEMSPRMPLDNDRRALVTIVIPCRNYAQFLPQAVESVIAQTMPNWELVIVDDGSSDGSDRVADKLRRSFPLHRIQTLLLNGTGPANARNAGAGLGQAPLLLMLDADDMLAADCLEQCVATLEGDPGLGFTWPVSIQMGSVNRLWSNRSFDLTELLSANRMPVSSLMRRSLFDQLGGFNPELKAGYEDWEFWLRAVISGWRGELTPEALFLYRKHPGSRNAFQANPEAELEAKRRIIESFKDWFIPEALNSPLLMQYPRIHPSLVNRQAAKAFQHKNRARHSTQVQRRDAILQGAEA